MTGMHLAGSGGGPSLRTPKEVLLFSDREVMATTPLGCVFYTRPVMDVLIQRSRDQGSSHLRVKIRPVLFGHTKL